jgi:hypothetical protein
LRRRKEQSAKGARSSQRARVPRRSWQTPALREPLMSLCVLERLVVSGGLAQFSRRVSISALISSQHFGPSRTRPGVFCAKGSMGFLQGCVLGRVKRRRIAGNGPPSRFHLVFVSSSFLVLKSVLRPCGAAYFHPRSSVIWWGRVLQSRSTSCGTASYQSSFLQFQ